MNLCHVIPQTPLHPASQAINLNQIQIKHNSVISIASNCKGKSTQLIQATKDPTQMTLKAAGLEKRKERDFILLALPPVRIESN